MKMTVVTKELRCALEMSDVAITNNAVIHYANGGLMRSLIPLASFRLSFIRAMCLAHSHFVSDYVCHKSLATRSGMDKDSKGKRKMEDSGGGLLPAVEGHSLE